MKQIFGYVFWLWVFGSILWAAHYEDKPAKRRLPTPKKPDQD